MGPPPFLRLFSKKIPMHSSDVVGLKQETNTVWAPDRKTMKESNNLPQGSDQNV